MAVRVQEADFDVGAELDRLTADNKKIGGLAVFVGLVREMHVREGYHKDRVDALTLEHYPGTTEKALEDIEAEANKRWPLEATLIVHRYGRMEPGDRKSTRLNSSHANISYAVFCLKKTKKTKTLPLLLQKKKTKKKH